MTFKESPFFSYTAPEKKLFSLATVFSLALCGCITLASSCQQEESDATVLQQPEEVPAFNREYE